MPMKTKPSPLSRSTKALSGTIGSIFRHSPSLFIFIVFLLIVAIYGMANTVHTTIIGLSLLVGFLSFLLYIKTDNFAESFLTFVLGIVAIYSVEWNRELAIIFGGTFAFFTVLFFLTSSVKIAAKIQWNATLSKNFLTNSFPALSVKEIQKLISQPTRFGMLSVSDRATALQYLAFTSVPLTTISAALDAIEDFNKLMELPLERSLHLYRIIRIIVVHTEEREISDNDLDAIKQCLLNSSYLPDELINILDSWRDAAVSQRLSFQFILDRIALHGKRGLSCQAVCALIPSRAGDP